MFQEIDKPLLIHTSWDKLFYNKGHLNFKQKLTLSTTIKSIHNFLKIKTSHN